LIGTSYNDRGEAELVKRKRDIESLPFGYVTLVIIIKLKKSILYYYYKKNCTDKIKSNKMF